MQALQLQRREIGARHGLGGAIEHEDVSVARAAVSDAGVTQIRRREPRGLGLQTLEGLGLVDDEAGMGAGADLVEIVLDGGFELDLAALHRRHLHRDLDRHSHQRRREVLDHDLHADRILAGIGVFDDQLAAGMLDVEDHGGSGVGARLLAHEADGAPAVDDDAVDPRYAGTKARLHVLIPSRPYDDELLKAFGRDRASGVDAPSSGCRSPRGDDTAH